MQQHRKKARYWLINTDRDSFEEVIYKAKITPRQQTIIQLRILKNTEIVKIAQMMNLSEETIQRDIKKAMT